MLSVIQSTNFRTNNACDSLRELKFCFMLLSLLWFPSIQTLLNYVYLCLSVTDKLPKIATGVY
jgi:hypothetical protein